MTTVVSEWIDKTFRVYEPIKAAFESLMDRKGDQMVAISAAMLWYVRATPQERHDFEDMVRRVEGGLMPLGDATTPPPGIEGESDLRSATDHIEIALKMIAEVRSSIEARKQSKSLDAELGEATQRVVKESEAKRSRRKSG